MIDTVDGHRSPVSISARRSKDLGTGHSGDATHTASFWGYKAFYSMVLCAMPSRWGYMLGSRPGIVNNRVDTILGLWRFAGSEALFSWSLSA